MITKLLSLATAASVLPSSFLFRIFLLYLRFGGKKVSQFLTRYFCGCDANVWLNCDFPLERTWMLFKKTFEKKNNLRQDISFFELMFFCFYTRSLTIFFSTSSEWIWTIYFRRRSDSLCLEKKLCICFSKFFFLFKMKFFHIWRVIICFRFWCSCELYEIPGRDVCVHGHMAHLFRHKLKQFFEIMYESHTWNVDVKQKERDSHAY